MPVHTTRRVGLRHFAIIAAILIAGVLMAQQSSQAQTTQTLRFVCADRIGQLHVVGNSNSCPSGYVRFSLAGSSPAISVCVDPPANTARLNLFIPCLWFEETLVLHGATEMFACTDRPLNRSFTERLRVVANRTNCPSGDYALWIPPGNPQASNDSYATAFETPLVVPPPGVLANDAINSGTITGFDTVSRNGGTVSVSADGGFTYTPPTGFTGVDSFRYTVTNDAGSSSATVTIQVMRIPVANNDAFVLAGSGTIPPPGVLGNDAVNGAAITSYNATTTGGGSVVLNANGGFSYTAPAVLPVTDTFTYTLTNLVGASTATVTLTLNQPPVAVADSYAVDEDATLSIAAPGVLANDTDPDGDPLNAAVVTTVSNGSLTLNADGSFSYTPASNFNGTDSFTYRALDNQGSQSSPATVTITVNPVNDPPTASDQTVSATEDTAVTITLTGSDIDGDAQTFSVVTGPADGTLGSIGSVSCVAGSCSASVTYTPGANFVGADSFTFTVNDGTTGSTTATVSITVASVNDAPVAVDDSYDSNGAATLTVPAPGVLGNDTDVDGDTLEAILVSDVTGGTLTLNPDGSFSYTADAGTASDSFTYRANDGQADSNVATVSITINAMPVADGQSVSTDEDTAITITLTGSDADDEDLTFAVDTPPGAGTLGTISAAVCTAVNTCTATVQYTPDANFNGTDSFTFVANDGHVDSAAATVTITVNPINDAPSFTAGDNQTVLEDSGMTTVDNWATAISAGPTADEDSQTLTFTVTADTPSLFSVQPDIDEATGDLTFTVAANAFGDTSVTVTLADSGGTASGGDDTSDAQSFTITVTGVNDAPSFTPGSDVTVNEDSGAYSAAWATAISAGANESGQVLTFNMSADDTSLFSSQPAISADGTLTFTPAADASGSTTVTVTLSDDGGTDNSGVDTTAPVTFTITITAINDAPSFTAEDPLAINEDAGAQTVTGWVTSVSTGPANESGQTILGYTVSNVVAESTLTFTTPPAVAANGTLTYHAVPNAYGTATFDVVVQDSGGGQDTSAPQTFTITVNPVNDAPSFTKGANQTVDEDAGAQTVNPWATSISAGPNESGQTLTFVVTNDNNDLFSSQPSVSSNGTLTYTPGANKNGTATVSVTLTDNGGTANSGDDTSDTQTFTITVTPVNDAPTAQTKSYTAQTNMRLSIDGPTQPAGDLLDGASDPDAGDPGFTSTLTIETVSATTPAGGTVSFNSTTGAFDFDPPPGVTGDVTFTYTVCDNGNPLPSLCSAPQTVTVTVSGPVIWFVNPNAATNGNGTLFSPFKFLSGQAGSSPANDVDDVDAANHRIFLYSGTATNGITLHANELLIGQGATNSPTNTFDALFGISPPAGTIARPSIGGTRPTISPSSGTAVTLNVNNRLQGFNVSAPAGIVGTDVDALIVTQVGITSTNGSALNIAGGTAQMNVALDSVVASSGASAGVSATNNTMGTLVITGSANTITATTGTALTISNTTIGAADLTFRSISANGAVNGILLTNTGSTGGLTITGTGTVGTGGTIQNTTGHGVSLTNTTDFSANNLSITGANMAGVDGTEVTNFTFTNGQILNAGDGRTDNLHGAIAFNDQAANENNIDGILVITGNLLKDHYGGGVDVFNRNGTITDATVSNNTIDSLADEATSREDAISFNLFGSTSTVASMTKAQIEDNIITDHPSGNGIVILGAQTTTGGPTGSAGVPGSATNRILIDGNTLTGDPTLRFGGAGILAGVEGRGQGNFHITNNDVTNVGTHGIATGNSGNTTVEYRITGNDVNANNFEAGAGGIRAATDKHIMADGSTLATPSIRVAIENNVIRNTTGIGIRVLIANSNGSAQVKVIGNDVANGGAGTPAIDIGNGSSADPAFNPTMCATISGNTTAANAPSGGGNTFPGILLAKRSTSATTYVFGIVGLTPSPSTNANTEAFLTALNPNANLGGGFYAGKRVAVNVGDNFTSCSHPAGF